MAPEIHEVRKNAEKKYDAAKTDIFALGVILFMAVFGSFPFEFALESDKLFNFLKEKKYEQFWKEHKAYLLEDK